MILVVTGTLAHSCGAMKLAMPLNYKSQTDSCSVRIRPVGPIGNETTYCFTLAGACTTMSCFKTDSLHRVVALMYAAMISMPHKQISVQSEYDR